MNYDSSPNRFGNEDDKLSFKYDYIFIGLSIVCQTAAHVFAKQAGIFSAANKLITIVINPWYGLLMTSLVLQALFWPLALRRLPLNFAYPFMSLVFPLTLVCARFIFQEEILINHLLGMFLIFCGIFIIAKEESS